MKLFTLQKRIEIIKILYKNGESLVETTRTFFSRSLTPCRTEIQNLVKKLKLCGQVVDVMKRIHAGRRILLL